MMAMDRGLNMVTINSSLIVGLGMTYNSSGSTIAYLKGEGERSAYQIDSTLERTNMVCNPLERIQSMEVQNIS